MLKKWILPIIAILGVIVTVNYMATGTPPPPVAEPVTQPPQVKFERYIGGAGLTEPNTENIAIGTQIPGVVREVMVNVGDQVKKGDVLFIIDNRQALAGVVQTQAELTQAKAEMQDRQDQVTLVNKIKNPDVVSIEERNKRRNALNAAKARVEALAAALDTATVTLDLHTVRAPSDGVVMTKNLRVGEFAPAGMVVDPMVRLGNLTPMHLRVDIDENDAWRFNKDAKAVAYVRGNPKISVDLQFVRVEPYVRPKRSLTGDSVERVDTRVLQIIYSFDVGDKPIYPGQQMDVFIEAKEE